MSPDNLLHANLITRVIQAAPSEASSFILFSRVGYERNDF